MMPVVLTIAGSDSGGGAGIQADLKTFHALGCFGTTAITAITAQNTNGVVAVQGIDPDMVVSQIDAVLTDFPVRGAKTGMLFSKEIIQAVQSVLQSASYNVPIVVDPVMVSSSGHRLLAADAEVALMEFISGAALVTPNIPEASVMLKREIQSFEEMENAVTDLQKMFRIPVLLKGGHRADHSNDSVLDFYYDGNRIEILTAPLMDPKHTHGTGCTLSAGIAAYLSRGDGLLESVLKAKEFLIGAIKNAPHLGSGIGPLNHLWKQN